MRTLESINQSTNNKMEKKETKDPLRKGGKQRGVTTQKMMSFRVDNDLIEWLDRQANKGRYINELIKRDKESKL